MLPKKHRLKQQREFNKIYRNGKKYSGRYFLLIADITAESGDYQNTRFGFVASKKVGKAVKRNLAKRKLRAIVAQEIPKLKPGYNCIFIAFSSLVDADHTLLTTEVIKAFKSLSMYR